MKTENYSQTPQELQYDAYPIMRMHSDCYFVRMSPLANNKNVDTTISSIGNHLGYKTGIVCNPLSTSIPSMSVENQPRIEQKEEGGR